jgi:transcriptional regulator with XRE-family HTH domain
MSTIDKILKLMKENNVSAAKLSREAGITNGLITQWKQGKQKPSLQNLEKIAKYFHVSLSSLTSPTEAAIMTTLSPILEFDTEKIVQVLYNNFKTDYEKQKLFEYVEKRIGNPNIEDVYTPKIVVHTKEEINLIDAYRKLENDDKERLVDYISLLLSNKKYGRKNSKGE